MAFRSGDSIADGPGVLMVSDSALGGNQLQTGSEKCSSGEAPWFNSVVKYFQEGQASRPAWAVLPVKVAKMNMRSAAAPTRETRGRGRGQRSRFGALRKELECGSLCYLNSSLEESWEMDALFKVDELGALSPRLRAVRPPRQVDIMVREVRRGALPCSHASCVDPRKWVGTACPPGPREQTHRPLETILASGAPAVCFVRFASGSFFISARAPLGYRMNSDPSCKGPRRGSLGTISRLSHKSVPLYFLIFC